MSYFFHFHDDAALGTGVIGKTLQNPLLERAALLTRAMLEVRVDMVNRSSPPPQGKPKQCVFSFLVVVIVGWLTQYLALDVGVFLWFMFLFTSC